MDKNCNLLLKMLHSVKFRYGNALVAGTVALILAALIMLAACGVEPTTPSAPTVASSPTLAPTATAGPVLPTPTPTPSPAPSPTPEPTPTPTPVPDPTPKAPVDRSALVSIYLDTGGDNWKSSRNWLSTAPIGEWYGIRVDEEGRVTTVELRANGLNGDVPEALIRLSNMETLDLSGNELSGGIPGELAELSGLTSLDISGNELSGEIPDELARLSSLELLDLSGNELTGAIPSALSALSSLKPWRLQETISAVRFRLNWLSDEPLSEWHGVTLDQSGQVIELDLRYNRLTGEIQVELADLAHLEKLLPVWEPFKRREPSRTGQSI